MTHNISELDESVKETLYLLRFSYEKEVPRDEYLRMFGFVVVDDEVYANEGVRTSKRLEDYLANPDNNFVHGALPDAIIKNGVVVKNRYGVQN